MVEPVGMALKSKVLSIVPLTWLVTVQPKFIKTKTAVNLKSAIVGDTEAIYVPPFSFYERWASHVQLVPFNSRGHVAIVIVPDNQLVG